MAALGGAELLLGFGANISNPAFTNHTLNAATDAAEFVFRADDAITITRLGFRQATLTGTAPVFRVSLQGVDSSGNPDGVDKTGATFDYTPTTGNNNTWQWVTLGASYTTARGELLALVIKHQSGTIDASNNCSFSLTSAFGPVPGLPYAIGNDAGVRTRQGAAACFGYGSAGTAYGRPSETLITAAYSSASTPDERGVKFTLPAGMGDTFKLAGVSFFSGLQSAGVVDVVLYDTDGTTVLQSASFDTDAFASTNPRWNYFPFDEATLSTLSFGSAYRVVLKPTTGSHTLHANTLDSAADAEAYPLGSAAAYTTRTDAGAWTDDAATRVQVGLVLADITEPAGGGATIIRRGSVLMKM